MYTLGLDIGTFESKGVIADHSGRIIAQSSRPHQMIVPQPDADLVPLADRLDDLRAAWRGKVIERPGRMGFVGLQVVARIIDHLKLRSGLPACIVLLGDTKHDSAVSAF